MERAWWVAERIASAPPLAIQGTVRSIWMAHDVGRRNAVTQVSSLVLLGTQYDNISTGQDSFKKNTERVEWTLR
jgi:hypothetical protein